MSDTSTATTGEGQSEGQGQGEGERAGSKERLHADLAEERLKRQTLSKTNAELQKQLDELSNAQKSDREKEIDAARKEAAAEARKDALASANDRIVRSGVRALAVERFADPEDPIGALDLSSFSVDDDGNVDRKAVNAAFDALLKQKPHWAKAGNSGTGSGDQGVRGSGATGTISMNDLIRKGARRS